MARTVLEVVVAGDSKSLERAMSRSSKATEKFGKDAQKHTARASVGIKGIGTAAKSAGLAFAGAGLVSGIRSLTDAAIESEKSNVRMRSQLKASGLSFKQYAGRIEEVIQKQSRLAALDDEQLQDAFTSIVRTTGNVEKSLRLVGVASDLARAKQMDVAKAGEIVAKVAGGNTGVLSRYGIQIEKGATATQALGELQRRFAGQAEAYGRSSAGSMDRFSVASENLREKLGAQLLPVISSGANSLTRFITQMETGQGAGGRFAEVVGQVSMGFRSVARDVGPPLRSIGRFVEKNPEIAKLAGGIVAVGVAVRGIKFASAITGVSALASGLAKLGAGPGRAIGQRVSEGLVQAFGGRRAAMRTAMSSTLANAGASAGTSGGAAAGSAMATSVVADGNKRRMSSAGRTLGRGFGRALSGAALAATVGIGVEIARQVNDELTDAIDDVFGGSRSGRSAGHDSLRKGPLNLLESVLGIGDGPGRGKLKSDVKRRIGTVPKFAGGSRSLMGAHGALAPFASVGFANGLRVTSGKRAAGGRTSSGGISYHGSGEAIDLAGSPDGMMRTFRALKSRFGPRLAELIYTPGGTGVKNGRPHTYTGKVAADHTDHVHVAFDLGVPGPGLGSLGGNRTGDGYGAGALRALAKGVGLSDSESITAAAVALAESGGNSRAVNRNSNGSVDRGLWQINSVHGSLSTFDVARNAKAMASISRGGSNWRPWVTYNTGAYKRFLSAARSARPSSSRSSSRKVAVGQSLKKGSGFAGGGFITSMTPIDGSFEASPAKPLIGPGGAPVISPDIGAPTGVSVAQFLKDQKYGKANADVALAALTDGTADGLAALTALQGIVSGDLEAAKGRGDYSAIVDLAGQLKSLNDQVKGMREDNNAALLEQTRALLELKDAALLDAQTRERLSKSQYGVLANAITDVVNGNLGGRVGLGFQTVGFPGTSGSVRY